MKNIKIMKLNEVGQTGHMILNEYIILPKGDVPITKDFNNDELVGVASNFRIEGDYIVADAEIDKMDIVKVKNQSMSIAPSFVVEDIQHNKEDELVCEGAKLDGMGFFNGEHNIKELTNNIGGELK